MRTGRLIPYEFGPDDELRAPRVSFVSFPFEWCDAQLEDAARLTIDISNDILRSGHELKDASAWNVIFDGTRPAFCDHLSFVPIERPEWWAFGQFVRHFILPLAVARLRDFRAHRAFLLGRDGLDAATARTLMGPRRFATRWWPLTMRMSSKGAGSPGRDRDPMRFRQHVYRYCELNIPRAARTRGSHWSSYAQNRPHYSESAARHKRTTIAGWLEVLKPSRVIDLGCNTGEYSVVAAAAGASAVVSIDSDHDSVQALYANAATPPGIHPVVADLADLPGGRGWMGSEAPGLVERLRGFADVVLSLALTHHLAIAESIPLERIALLIDALSASHAIVELIDENDPMVVELCAQRQRQPAEFSLDRQRAALARRFVVECEERLPGSGRSLALLRKLGDPRR